jgi:hypothetical protein
MGAGSAFWETRSERRVYVVRSAAAALRLTAKEYLRSTDDRIEGIDDLLEELAASQTHDTDSLSV